MSKVVYRHTTDEDLMAVTDAIVRTVKANDKANEHVDGDDIYPPAGLAEAKFGIYFDSGFTPR